MLERDDSGVLHIVALSGGHDSTIMSFLLKEREPRPYNYLCTPAGDELPEMFEFWRWLGTDNALGRPLLPIMANSLKKLVREQKAIPNNRMRFCTRMLKIEPYRAFLIAQAAQGPVVSYVGLRADEPGRAGGLMTIYMAPLCAFHCASGAWERPRFRLVWPSAALSFQREPIARDATTNA